MTVLPFLPRKSGAAWVLVLVLALMLAAGCSRKAESDPLRVGVIPVEDNFPFFVAEQEGMFEKLGLRVELVPFNSARDRDLALQAGKIDGETADPVAVALLRKSGTAAKIICLTMGARPEEGRFVLLAAPSGRVKNPQDLRGATLAVSENTVIEYVADQLLANAGLNPAQVSKTPVPDMAQRLQLLLGGRVDAAVLPDPLATLAQEQGAPVLMDDTRQKENLSQVVLVFREEVIRSRRDDLVKLVRAYQQAAAEVTARPQAFRELFVERTRLPEALRDTYLTPRYSAPALPQPEDLDRVIRWMVAKGLLSDPYSYHDLVEEGVLKDLEP
ncbi:MAG: MetQ/NlpA family ABC transporter substrate-binding protein [Clostridia bacterium]|jgi:NitT/TauT family transport system substrate-binding protein|nr:MetQ/NlpA family ABC transporter substrate-binding protein [Clostridia bacterium]MDH7572910.1 MetQ/NlpA family ABC transporter substrate-binding protein [Clostridia bacterium]